jgi:hypothetical protein
MIIEFHNKKQQQSSNCTNGKNIDRQTMGGASSDSGLIS